ncbi:MAG TPA: YbhB/YbcL family Raf kinase inhibitor-like protein [Casimicrobiaceae bacterium]|nr:YbhB/YbcL family Raf kinase inhibitor-like protein [Casimicrobiaceae bacterium]
MRLSTTAFADAAPMPADYAFCKQDPTSRITLSLNRNPDFVWSDAPTGTESFALICHDPDVPSRADDVNQEGRRISATLPRVEFFHWVLIDLPRSTSAIARGAHADGVTARGKPGPNAPGGGRHGINDYTAWFANDKEMAGDYYGYDGPCPPWNDELVHRYVFTLYALDVAKLDVQPRFTGTDARNGMRGHVLAEASVSGRYSLNPKVRLG